MLQGKKLPNGLIGTTLPSHGGSVNLPDRLRLTGSRGTGTVMPDVDDTPRPRSNYRDG